ncbi:MAG: GTPase HflX [Cyclobacteriaceae bacterium]|nr:GTPase HflX [Cyclobacteriaceae bacterium]
MNDVVQKLAIVVAVTVPQTRPEEIEEHLSELEFLAETADIQTSKRFIQKLPAPDGRTYVGSGKIREIKDYMAGHGINTIIVDDDLTPSQLKNLEKELNPSDKEARITIYDRSLLILDIFLRRAQTAQARTQVEMARNQYLLPRLTRMWTHLERQRGGTGTRGGAGEKEIETDRRTIRRQITLLKEDLDRIDRQRQTQRKGRQSSVRVSLVGYTNVGKSTLMNLLSKSQVKAENKLFATVDSTVRKVVLNNIPFLLSDTVGFIRKLPHHLIESFKSTLDEVREADILLHVVDIAHPFHDNHLDVVTSTLTEIGAVNQRTILVLNKIDMLDNYREIDFTQWAGRYRERGFDQVVFVSAQTREHMEELRAVLFAEVKQRYMQIYPNYVLPTDYTEEVGE